MQFKMLFQKTLAFNSWLGDWLADSLATMAMFYGVTFLVTIPLRWQVPQDIPGWVNYLSSNFFQGVALPIIGYSAKREGNRNYKLLLETHDTVMAEFKEFKKLHQLEIDELASLRRIEVFKDVEDSEVTEILQYVEKMRSRSNCRQRNQARGRKKS